MKINCAHLRERSTSGGWINFAVFGAKSTSGSKSANAALLQRLTSKARSAGLKVGQSALAYLQGARIQFFGSQNLVDYLSRSGIPQWTRKMDV